MHEPPHDPADAYGRALRSDSVHARERDRRRYGPRRGPSTWIYWTVAAVGLVLFAVLMRAVMEKTKWTAGSSADERADVPPAPAGPIAPVRPGCLVLVDPYTRTYVDRCGSKRPLTAAEREALKRQADAAR